MALHAKLQLSARLWRAPLWPVVLSLCDWLTGHGGVETSPFFPSSAPSLPVAFFHSQLLYCTACHLDQAVTSLSVLVYLAQGQQLFPRCWNFTSAAAGLQLSGKEGDRERGKMNHCLAAYPKTTHNIPENVLLSDWYWSVVLHPLLSLFDQLFLTHVAFQHTDRQECLRHRCEFD